MPIWILLSLLQLVSELEDTFDIQVTPTELIPTHFNSAKAIWAMVQRLQQERLNELHISFISAGLSAAGFTAGLPSYPSAFAAWFCCWPAMLF